MRDLTHIQSTYTLYARLYGNHANLVYSGRVLPSVSHASTNASPCGAVFSLSLLRCSTYFGRLGRDVLLTVLAPGRPSAETEGLHRSPDCRTALSSDEDALPGPQRRLARPWQVLHDRTWYKNGHLSGPITPRL
jgi:hypothetical protein